MYISPMIIDDVEYVAELDRICFPTPWSVSAYITETHNPAGFYIVAREDERIVGFAGEWLVMDEAHITTIGVDPQYRRRKIGERMLICLLDEAISRGAKRVSLEVRRYNHTAQTLYKKYMFEEMAIRKRYYTNNNEDALVMWINDMQSPEFQEVFNNNKNNLEIQI
ncbi:MAG: ribosomal protein S18-alanine N-acetyltransferase [Armatimonadota bacterium]